MDDAGREAKTLVIVSQVYVPDPASVGQHMHDAAAAMVQRGWRVVVFASARGYDDPSRRYPKREMRDGVEIRRLPMASLGKRSLAARLIGGMLFVVQAAWRGLFVRRPTLVLVSTSPPMAALTAMLVRAIRGVPFVFWAMDINPDQMIAMGRVSSRSWAARLFEAMIRATLRRARAVVTLDAFMAERLRAKADVGEKLTVLAPWPHEQHVEPVSHEANPFREEHDLRERFVVMYSGNLSPSHPLETILEAARRLERERPGVLFMFIGEGLLKRDIERFVRRHGLANVRLLAYQPAERLRYSLSAADVHLVSMGEAMVGIVHPCKVYGALAAGRPVLLLGPGESHVGRIVEEHNVGWRVDHGDVDEAVRTIAHISQAGEDELAAMGRRAREVVSQQFGKGRLVGAFCDVLERSAARPG